MHNRLKAAALVVLTALAANTLAAQAPFAATLPGAGTSAPGLDGGSVLRNLVSPGSSLAGGATLTFDLFGYLSVDGANCCTDTFRLTINSVLMFEGGFVMGGGGSNFVNYIDPGVTIVSTTNNGLFLGGLTKFSVAHTLLAGNNTYLFDYGVMQGLSDEGWGFDNADVNARVFGVVPEPASVAMLAFGLFGIAGVGVARRRKGNAAL